jgi:hypothetical protein
MPEYFDFCLKKWTIKFRMKYQNIELFIFWNFKSGQIPQHSKVLFGIVFENTV